MWIHWTIESQAEQLLSSSIGKDLQEEPMLLRINIRGPCNTELYVPTRKE